VPGQPADDEVDDDCRKNAVRLVGSRHDVGTCGGHRPRSFALGGTERVTASHGESTEPYFRTARTEQRLKE